LLGHCKFNQKAFYRLLISDEPIADPRFGKDDLWPFRIDLEFFTKLPHIYAQIFSMVGIRGIPDVGKDAVMGEHPPVVRGEVGKQPVFCGGQLDLLVIAPDTMPGKVDG
jgi:hypothetical protein